MGLRNFRVKIVLQRPTPTSVRRRCGGFTMAGIAAWLLAVGFAAGPSPVRIQAAQPESLPPLAGAEDLVFHAGRTVEFRLPTSWQVREVPNGREVRLYAAPGPFVDKAGSDWQGLWLRHAPLENGQFRQPGEIQELLARRLQKTTNNRARGTGSVHEATIDGVPAWQVEFEAPGNYETGAERLLGYHLLARSGSGLFELHVALPESAEAIHHDALQRLVQSIRIRPPRGFEFQTGPTMADAVQIVGTWKAHRARWTFAPDGRIHVLYDRAGTFALDETGSVRYDRPVKQLDGTAAAQGDVLKIAWDDGSRLNLRWTIHKGDLLFTDHTGRTSQLKRLFD